MKVHRATTEENMASIISRIAAIARHTTMGAAIAGCACMHASAQGSSSTPPTPAAKSPAPAAYSGCVQKAPGSTTDLVISTPTACAKLAGKFSVDDLAGHQVELKGILTPRSASTSATIQVDSVVSVGQSCTDVCSLRPPGTRGLHPPQAVPGSEGGTPGAVAPPQ
jgi:hypothetical protein